MILRLLEREVVAFVETVVSRTAAYGTDWKTTEPCVKEEEEAIKPLFLAPGKRPRENESPRPSSSFSTRGSFIITTT